MKVWKTESLEVPLQLTFTQVLPFFDTTKLTFFYNKVKKYMFKNYLIALIILFIIPQVTLGQF
ncbi:MAG TPA: hypothetical protein VHT72_11385, partial [Puia sp.]|nr:hypothetical protein [Puia sp.]